MDATENHNDSIPEFFYELESHCPKNVFEFWITYFKVIITSVSKHPKNFPFTIIDSLFSNFIYNDGTTHSMKTMCLFFKAYYIFITFLFLTVANIIIVSFVTVMYDFYHLYDIIDTPKPPNKKNRKKKRKNNKKSKYLETQD